MGKLGFYFDMDSCVGCCACAIACKDRADLPVGNNFRRVLHVETGEYPKARWFHLSMACNHCENPACVAKCPTGAMFIAEDGTVQHDDNVCIGCQTCVMSCPYGAPQYVESLGIVQKCDSCKPLRDAGMNPVCVDACIQRALEFGDIEELEAAHADQTLVNEIPIIAPPDTNPSLRINPKPYALEADEFRFLGL